jgi:hypothetical protein
MPHLDSFDFGQIFYLDNALFGEDDFVGSAVGYFSTVPAPDC